MAEMTISINSRPFQIMCRDGEEAQVGKLAEELATRVAQLKKTAANAGDSHLLVLAGLTLCSELRDLQHDIASIKSDMDKASGTREALAGRLDELESTVAEALNGAAERVEKLLEKSPSDAL